MTVLVVIEHVDGEPTEPSLQALTFVRGYAAGEPVHALAVGLVPRGLGEHGVGTVHLAEHDAFGSFAPAAVARSVVETIQRIAPSAVVAPGSELGNEVMAHVAAMLDLPLAANCISATGGDVTRIRWGGSLLEEATMHADVVLLTVQPHAVVVEKASVGEPAVERFTPELSDADRAVRVTGRVEAAAGGVSLADAKIVVSAGRGAGSAEGVGIIEELSFTTVRHRLASFLLRLAQKEGKRAGEGIQVALPASNQELASQIGTVRELVSRNLSRLQAEGMLQLDGRHVLILDLKALEEASQASE